MERIFWGRFFAKLGDQLCAFAIPILVYKATGSLGNAGLAFFIERLPKLFYFPFSGVINNHLGPKKALIIADVLRVLICLTITFFSYWNLNSSAFIIAIFASLISMANGQSLLSIEVLVSSTADKHGANSLMSKFSKLQFADHLPIVLGPLITIIISNFFNTQDVVLLAGLSFLLSSLLYSTVKSTAKVKDKQSLQFADILKQIYSGPKILLNTPKVFLLIALSFGINLLLGVMLSTSAGLITGVWERVEADFGVLNLVGGVLALASLLWINRLKKQELNVIKNLGLTAFLMMNLGGIFMTQVNSFHTFIVAYLMMLFPLGVFNVFVRTLRSTWMAKEDLAQGLSTILLITQSSFPLAGLLVKVLLESYSVQTVFMMVSSFNIAILSVVFVLIKGPITKRFAYAHSKN